jgi:hypothetical protein
MKSIAKNCMPEVLSDLLYDFQRILESCPQELGWATDPRIYAHPSEG